MKELLKAVILSATCTIALSCSSDCIYNEPNLTKFDSIVSSSQLKDSLKNGTVTSGMPNYVFAEILKPCSIESGIQVASFGSTQKLLNYGPYGKVFQDPHIKIYLDKYNTPKGTLFVWYGYQDFYSMKTEAYDTLILYTGENVDTALVLYLTTPRELRIDKDLNYSNVNYGEIHHQNPDIGFSYYYNLRVQDSVVNLKTTGKDLYPVYHIILENKVISSFRYRK